MSMITDITAAVKRAVAHNRRPTSIRLSHRSLVNLAEQLRRTDVERRKFSLMAINGAPYVYDPRKGQPVPVKPAAFYYVDKEQGINLRIPFIESPVVLDDRFYMEFDGTIERNKPRDKGWWRRADTQDTPK